MIYVPEKFIANFRKWPFPDKQPIPPIEIIQTELNPS